MNALTSAEPALACIESLIPIYEVIDTMRTVGDAMPTALRETGMGGIAASSSEKKYSANDIRAGERSSALLYV